MIRMGAIWAEMGTLRHSFVLETRKDISTRKEGDHWIADKTVTPADAMYQSRDFVEKVLKPSQER
jgi:hypothetical protein